MEKERKDLKDNNLERFMDIAIMEIESNPEERKAAMKLFKLEDEGDK